MATYKWKLATLLVISYTLMGVYIEVSDNVYINIILSLEFLLPALCFGIYFFASPSKSASKIMLLSSLSVLMLGLFLIISEIELSITDDIHFDYQTSLFSSLGLIIIAFLSTKLKKDINNPVHIIKSKYTYLAFVSFVFYLFGTFANHELNDLFSIFTHLAQDTLSTANVADNAGIEVISVVGTSGTVKPNNFVICLILFFIWGASIKSWAKASSFILVTILTMVAIAIEFYFMMLNDGMRFEEALFNSSINNLFFILSCSLMTYFGQQCREFFKLNSGTPKID
jgi:hypothetical protein